MGDWDQDVEDVDEQELSLAAVHFHPQYNVGAYLNNDLAVVATKEEARLSSRVVPVCLPAPATSYTPGTQCTISGWGSTGQASGGYSRRLQAAVVPILETRRCMEKQVYGPDKLTSGMVCAGAGVIISSYASTDRTRARVPGGRGGQLPGGQRRPHGEHGAGHHHAARHHQVRGRCSNTSIMI